MAKQKIEYDKLSVEEKKAFDDVKNARKTFNNLRNKGTWKYVYVEVRNKTLELEKDDKLTGNDKIKAFKDWYKDNMDFKPRDVIPQVQVRTDNQKVIKK